jgi:hypothetical protein
MAARRRRDALHRRADGYGWRASRFAALVSLFAEHIDSLEEPIPVAVETQRLKGASCVSAL